jgi:integrase/recombinase XerD
VIVRRRRGRARNPSEPPSISVGMWAHREGYLDWMRARNYSLETIRSRAHDLGSFLNWCDERSLIEPTDVTQPIVERYQRWLFYRRQANGRPLTVRSQIR